MKTGDQVVVRMYNRFEPDWFVVKMIERETPKRLVVDGLQYDKTTLYQVGGHNRLVLATTEMIDWARRGEARKGALKQIGSLTPANLSTETLLEIVRLIKADTGYKPDPMPKGDA